MTKRKIKIVDVDNYEDVQLQIQDEPEGQVETIPEVEPEQVKAVKAPAKRQPAVKKAPVEEVTLAVADLSLEPVKEPVKEVEEPEVLKPDRKVRVQELAECPDCNKMITPKSLKHTHKKKKKKNV